jgi:arylsulfatase A-like enzyme
MDSQITRREALTRMAQLGMIPAAMAFSSRLWAADGKQPPNILYIMADDHAAPAMSCYGGRLNKTPNIDRIANEGMRFTNCFCTNSLCGPSRAVLLTGKYSHINGFRDNGANTHFNGAQQTFIKMLGASGYQTAIIGKWHLNSTPTGFDYWCILPGQGVYFDPQFNDMGKMGKVNGYVTDIITDKTIDRIKGRDKNKPFCILCHHKAPHREWSPDEKHAKMYEDVEIPLPPTLYDDYSNRGTAAHDQQMTIAKALTKTDLKQDPPAGLTGDALTKWKYERFIKDYLRVIASVDDNVGRLLDLLDKEGLAENTIVIYTSDNGFFLGDHGWFDKRFMYEESLHIPFVVRYPGHIKPGTVVNDLAINADFAPTFLEYAGVKPADDMQGHSLRPVFEGHTPADWRQSMYYHYYEFPQPHHVHPHYGVRTQKYKLIYFYTLKEWELYDLEKDHYELKSVYNDPAYAEVRKELTAELERLRKELKDNEG